MDTCALSIKSMLFAISLSFHSALTSRGTTRPKSTGSRVYDVFFKPSGRVTSRLKASSNDKPDTLDANSPTIHPNV